MPEDTATLRAGVSIHTAKYRSVSSHPYQTALPCRGCANGRYRRFCQTRRSQRNHVNVRRRTARRETYTTASEVGRSVVVVRVRRGREWLLREARASLRRGRARGSEAAAAAAVLLDVRERVAHGRVIHVLLGSEGFLTTGAIKRDTGVILISSSPSEIRACDRQSPAVICV